jgi:hypothetical protein
MGTKSDVIKMVIVVRTSTANERRQSPVGRELMTRLGSHEAKEFIYAS